MVHFGAIVSINTNISDSTLKPNS